jgi:hypothetical protein
VQGNCKGEINTNSGTPTAIEPDRGFAPNQAVHPEGSLVGIASLYGCGPFLLVKASCFQTIEQGLFAKRLAQESNCPSGQYLRTRGLIGMPRNKDRRRREAIGPETLIELHATQTGHMHIGDQTGGVVNILRTKKIFG